jgi:hypothetical protein
MPVCRRCGACCGECRYLVKHRGGLTSCRIYRSRLGVLIRPSVRCGLREEVHKNFPDCPFNRPEWEEKAEKAEKVD